MKLEEYIAVFKEMTGSCWEPEPNQLSILNNLFEFNEECGFRLSENYRDIFFEAVNQKLDLNNRSFRYYVDLAFKLGLKLNYHEKNQIKVLLDKGSYSELRSFLESCGFDSGQLDAQYSPLSNDQSLARLQDALSSDSKRNSILSAIFSRFMFHIFDEKCTSLFFFFPMISRAVLTISNIFVRNIQIWHVGLRPLSLLMHLMY